MTVGLRDYTSLIRMGPKIPSRKIEKPREFAEREGAIRVGDDGGDATVRSVDPCPLCNGEDVPLPEMITLAAYPTGQRELLASFIVASRSIRRGL